MPPKKNKVTKRSADEYSETVNESVAAAAASSDAVAPTVVNKLKPVTVFAFYAIDEDGCRAGSYVVPWYYFSKDEQEKLMKFIDECFESSCEISFLKRENVFAWRLGKRLGWWIDENFPDQDEETAKLTCDLVQFRLPTSAFIGPLMGVIIGNCFC